MFFITIALQTIDDEPVGVKPSWALPVALRVEPRRIKRCTGYGVGWAKQVFVLEQFYYAFGAFFTDTAGIKWQKTLDARLFKQFVGNKIARIVHFGIGIPQFFERPRA